jgi:anti-sigma factor RsiW
MEHPRTELLPHLRGELAADARQRVTAHLAACPECAREYAAFATIAGALRDASAPALEPHWGRWRAGLHDKLAARSRRHARGWWPVPLAVSAGLAGVLLAVALLSGPSGRSPDPPSVEETVLGGHLDLLREYSVVEQLDLLENLELIRQLDRLAPQREG